MSSLRLLIALPGLHRVNRGAEVVLEEVGRRAASENGLDVTLIGNGKARPGEPYTFKHARGIKREWFEKFPRIPYLRDHYAYEEFAFAPSLYFNYSPRRYDVTFTCGYPYTNWILRSGRKNGAPKHVFVTQNGDWMVHANNWEYKHFSCDGLVCTNPQYYDRNKNRFPCALIPNGVDTARFFPGQGDRASLGLPLNVPIILTVAALIPSKRVIEAIRAAARVPHAHFVLAGDGEQRDQVDALGKELLADRFQRITLPREKMPELYRSASVLLHMSQDEPFGNIYIEAMASGLPVVAHESDVTQWIVEDQAQLVDTSDESAVVRAITRALDWHSPLQIAARRELAVRRFSWESVAREYCEFFRKVASA